jgi:parallel beta-helix repeat protein
MTNDRRFAGKTALMLLAALLLLSSAAANATVSVRDFGAKGDGKTDDTPAFQRALAAGGGELFIPEGQYRIANLKIPDGTMVRGVGVRSTITMPPDVEAAMLPGNDCALTDLHFVGSPDDKASPIGHGLVLLRYVHGVSLARLTMENSPRCGVITDHAEYFRVADSHFKGVAAGVMVVFSHHGIISGNFVEDAKMHGMQFWGNWNFEQKDVSDLAFTGNVIRNVGGGGIWGTGGVRIAVTGNTVDGAGDICLDYEWCDDSSIVGNTVRNGKNAGISLFYGCMNITIAGNTVVVPEETEAAVKALFPYDDTKGKPGWPYVGIWLTDPDRPKFPKDLGHRVIAITGNTVRVEGPKRPAVYIGVDSHDVTLSGNVLSNGDVVDKTKP